MPPSCLSSGSLWGELTSAARGTVQPKWPHGLPHPTALVEPALTPLLPHARPRYAQVCPHEPSFPGVWGSWARLHRSDRGLLWGPGSPALLQVGQHVPHVSAPSLVLLTSAKGAATPPSVPKKLPEAPPWAFPCSKPSAYPMCAEFHISLLFERWRGGPSGGPPCRGRCVSTLLPDCLRGHWE